MTRPQRRVEDLGASDPAARLHELVERGAQDGGVFESEIEGVAAELELGEDELQRLRDQLAERDVPVDDDCGRPAPVTGYANGELAAYSVGALDQFLAGAMQHRLLTASEELELARRIERGDLEAKERLVTHNLRLVVSIARRYPRTELSLLDLIQDGTLGLIRAAELYDWRRGYRFSTYATLWIRQSISRALTKHSRTIRLPAGVAHRERRLALAREALTARLDHEPTIDELAAEAGIDVAHVRDLDQAARVVTSLDRPVAEMGTASLGEMLPDQTTDVGQEVVVSLEHEAVRRAVAALPEPDREVVTRRFGIDGDPRPETHQAIARDLDITPAKVRAIEKRALADLARLRELHGILRSS